MKLINKDIEVLIPDELLNNLIKAGIKEYPKEFGGFLIGYYSKDFKTLYITDTLLPIKYKVSKYSFERSTEGIIEYLKKKYNLSPKQYYVGEWHTHPDSSTKYSSTDLNSMIEIAKCKTVRITNPILMILSISKTKMNGFSFYVYDNKKLLKYE